MDTVNASELINAGVSFQMQNEDADFGPDGELLGYTEVSKEVETFDGDGDYRNRWFSTSEGVTDTTELSQPYWDAVAESHVEAMKRDEWLATPRKSDEGPVHGEMEFWQTQRVARFERLLRYIRRASKSNALKAKRGAQARYIASIKMVVARGKNEWFLLYLTKEQMQLLWQG